MFKRNLKKVYVLGAGPAGLLAARAALEMRYETGIYSAPDKYGMPKKSELFGCQYLHAYIPGVGLMRDGYRNVSYQLKGTVDGYRTKVYGDGWSGKVSPD